MYNKRRAKPCLAVHTATTSPKKREINYCGTGNYVTTVNIYRYLVEHNSKRRLRFLTPFRSTPKKKQNQERGHRQGLKFIKPWLVLFARKHREKIGTLITAVSYLGCTVKTIST